MSKNTITKCLLTISNQQTLQMEEIEVSTYAQVNRVLDRVGYFTLDFVEIDKKRYLLVFEEEHVLKSKILVSRIHETEERVVDITKDDYNQIQKIAY